jgi:hypothetical protein
METSNFKTSKYRSAGHVLCTVQWYNMLVILQYVLCCSEYSVLCTTVFVRSTGSMTHSLARTATMPKPLQLSQPCRTAPMYRRQSRVHPNRSGLPARLLPPFFLMNNTARSKKRCGNSNQSHPTVYASSKSGCCGNHPTSFVSACGQTCRT